MDAVERAAALRAYAEEHLELHALRARRRARTQVVFGSGSPNADLMFVGEAPGFHEDQQGVPFVGPGREAPRQAARRDRARRAPTSSSRTSSSAGRPGIATRMPEEIAACEPHLFRQIELIQPTLVATLGNFATKLLSGKPARASRACTGTSRR